MSETQRPAEWYSLRSQGSRGWRSQFKDECIRELVKVPPTAADVSIALKASSLPNDGLLQWGENGVEDMDKLGYDKSPWWSRLHITFG